MNVDIYPSHKPTTAVGRLYIVVPAGQPIPPPAVAAWGPFGSRFKTINVKEGDNRIAMDGTTVLASIAEHGFAVLGAAVIVG